MQEKSELGWLAFFIGWEVLYEKSCVFDFVCQLHMDWVWVLSINA